MSVIASLLNVTSTVNFLFLPSPTPVYVPGVKLEEVDAAVVDVLLLVEAEHPYVSASAHNNVINPPFI